jgi:hypothetical protein
MFVGRVRRNQNTMNFGQGPLMGSITTGFS